MGKMIEKTVFGMRVPACAKVESVKHCRELGIVAMTMDCNGNAVTFFRTDFLPELERVAWDDTEVLVGRGFHEEIPENVTKSIKNAGGIFIARDFVMANPEGTKALPSDGHVERRMNHEYAKSLAASLEVPEMDAALIYGAVYDMMGRWLIATGSLTEEEWVNSPKSKEAQNAILDRDCGEWTIRELFGNIFKTEWTQEFYENSAVTREGTPFSDGEGNYPARKRYMYPTWMHHPDAVARAMWSFKM
jgi:hypothetical protein